MPTAALVGATWFNAAHFARQRFDLTIAVDGGFASLGQAGVSPDCVVGDFDSLGYVPEGDDVRRYPAEKDESDMELAMRIAFERGCTTMLAYGAFAGRLDHTFANLQLAAGFARRGARVFGIGDGFALTVLDGRKCPELSFDAFDPAFLDDGEYGRFVSVFSYGGTAHGVTESGLKYSLENASVPDDLSLGLSNEFTGLPSRIALAEGNALVVFPLDAWSYLKGL